MRITRLFASKRRTAVLLAASAVGVAAVSGVGVGTSAAAGGGDQLVVGTMAPVGNATNDFGGVFAGLKAALNAANAKGGVNGKKVKIWTCNNSSFTASQELACARKAVNEGVDVFVGDNNSLSGDAYPKIFRDAGIADVMNTGPLPNGFQTGLSFPVAWPVGTIVACVTKQMGKLAGGNKFAYVTNTQAPVDAFLKPLYDQAVKNQGLGTLERIAIPFTTADYGPVVARAVQSGAKTVMLNLMGGAAPQAFIRAASAANAKFKICLPLGLSGVGGFYNLGSAASRTYVGTDYAPLTSDVPGMRRFRKEMAAEGKRGDKYASISPKTFIGQTMETWLGAQVVLQAAKDVKGAYTPASMARAIKNHKKYSFGGIIDDLSFRGKPASGQNSPVASVRGFQRIFNSDAYIWKWNGKDKFSQVAAVPNTFGLVSK